MKKTRSVILLLSVLSVASGLNSGAEAGTELKGKVDTNKLNGEANSSDDFLQGGIKNEAQLEPSLKVIPGQARKNNVRLQSQTPKYFYPTGAALTQFHGGAQVSGPSRQSLVPLNAVPDVEQYRGSGRVGHQIAPISSYTLSPTIQMTRGGYSGSSAISTQRGVSSYVPGFEVQKITEHKGVTSYVPGHSVQQPSMNRGVTAYDPGYSTVVTHYGSSMGSMGWAHGGARPVPGPIAREGVTAYAPGYSAIHLPAAIHSGISSLLPGSFIHTPTTSSISTERHPGYQVTITTPKNGVVCWDSKYESTVVHNSLTKQTLGGMWYEPSRVRPEAGDRGKTEALAPKPEFAVPVVDTPGQSLAAVPLGLPGLRPVANTQLTWDDWYQRVARAVYGRWQDADVGPGRATVAVTVKRDRSISGQVVAFTPAEDVERDAEEETAFKKAALSAVNLVSEFEIPEFPPSAEADSVTFNVEMKREVDGPVGFDVASTPKPDANNDAPALQSEEAKPAILDKQKTPNATKKNRRSKK